MGHQITHEGAANYSSYTPIECSMPNENARQTTDQEEFVNWLLPTVKPAVAVPLLLFVALSPLLVMLVFVTRIHSVFIAMVVMHWLCMTGLPLLYIRCFVGNFDYYFNFLRCQVARIRFQWLWGLLAFTIATIVVFSSYLFVKCDRWNSKFCAHMKSKAMEEGFGIPLWSLITFGGYFVIVNPMIEEMFWRVFLYRELGATLFLHSKDQILHPNENTPLLPCWRKPEDRDIDMCNNNNESKTASVPVVKGTFREITDYSEFGGEEHLSSTPLSTGSSLTNSDNHSLFIINAAASPENGDTPDGQVPHDNGKIVPEFYDIRLHIIGHMLLSVLYGSYHCCVMYHLLGRIYALLIFIFLVALGVLLIYIRNIPKLGIFTAMLLHAGVDFGAVLAYVNVFFRFI